MYIYIADEVFSQTDVGRKLRATHNFRHFSVNLTKDKKMRTALHVDITFDQVLALVRQLPTKEKIKLTKELEKEGIQTKLSGLLKTFRTKELSLEILNEEVEIVRQQIYESKKH